LVPFALFYALRSSNGSKLPIINDKRLREFSDKRTKQNFVLNGRRLLREGLKTFGSKPFKILTDFGYATILPPEYANEVRNIDSLSHVRAIAKVWLGGSDGCLYLFSCYNTLFPLLVVRIYANTTPYGTTSSLTLGILVWKDVKSLLLVMILFKIVSDSN
jgi:hypothetical protein